jgi:hypothetical protein
MLLSICYSALRYSTQRYSTQRYSTLRYSTQRYSTLRYSTQRYSTQRYSTLRCSTGWLSYWPQKGQKGTFWAIYALEHSKVGTLCDFRHLQFAIRKKRFFRSFPVWPQDGTA